MKFLYITVVHNRNYFRAHIKICFAYTMWNPSTAKFWNQSHLPPFLCTSNLQRKIAIVYKLRTLSLKATSSEFTDTALNRTTNSASSSSREGGGRGAGKRKVTTGKILIIHWRKQSASEKQRCISEMDILNLYKIQQKHTKESKKVETNKIYISNSQITWGEMTNTVH